MAGNIPIRRYTPQVGTPQGTIAGATANVPGSYRMDVSGFDQLSTQIRVRREQAEENDLRTAMVSEDTNAQLATETEYRRLTSEWAPGSPDVPEAIGGFVDRYMGDLQKRFPQAAAAPHIADRGAQLKTHYGLRALEFQTKANVTGRKMTLANAYANAANLGSLDPSKLGPELAKINATVAADTEIPELEKAEFVRTNSQASAKAVAMAMVDLDARRAYALTDTLLGVEQPTLVTSGERFEQAIAQLESGGRMFDGRGAVLRGPAIRAADGSTYHAWGKYQLTEATARATAQKAGVDWNPDLFFGRSGDKQATAAYHEELGIAHITANAARFGNDPIVVAAAHNMGPEAAAGWAAGRPYQTQSGKWWYPNGPKDLRAMPDETRNYVGKLGSVRGETASVARVDNEDATAFRLLDVADVLEVRSHAASRIAAAEREAAEQRAVGAEAFKARLADITSAAVRGESFEMPADQDFLNYLGPGKGALERTRLGNYQRMAGVLQALPGLGNAELAAYAVMPNPEGVEDRTNRQFVRDTIAKRAQLIVAQRAADPGQAAMDTSPQVQQRMAAWSAAATEFYQAGPQSTPEQFAALATAQSDFVRTAFAQQRAWGVEEPRLPKAILSKLADGFRVQLERDPINAAIYFERLPDLLGNDEAVAEVAAKAGPLAMFAMDGVPGMTIKKLQAMLALPEAKRVELLSAGSERKKISDAVRSTFDPLLDTLAAQYDAQTADRYIQAGEMLTISRMTTEGGSAKAAARAAYAELFSDRHVIIDKFRLPTSKYDPMQIRLALNYIQGTWSADNLQVTPEPGFSMEESRERKQRTVRFYSHWVNNAAGSGVLLMHATGPVRDAQGRPIEVRFDRAQELELPTPRTPDPKAFKGTRGLMY